MNSLSLITIPILPLGLVNAFLAVSPHGVILIDAGLPDTEKKIKTALYQNGLSLHDIKLIIITHAHIDHAGNARKLKELTGAPILAHSKDLPYYQGKKQMTFCATGWFGRLFFKTGLIQKKYDYFTPDILIENQETLDLDAFGFNGKVISSPGHTEGSISVILDEYHDDGKNRQYAIVGDLISSGILLGGICCKNIPKRPPFEDDPQVVSQSLNCLLNYGSQRFYMGHGGPLTAQKVKLHVATLQKSERSSLSCENIQ